MTTNEIVEAVYDLGVGAVSAGANRHERPHKPVLLLAVLNLVARGECTPEKVLWSQALRDEFGRYFAVVRRHNDQNTPENPFLYLGSDGFWAPRELDDSGVERELKSTPLVGQLDSGRVFARIAADWAAALASASTRMVIREAILSRYFPKAAARLRPLFSEPLILSEGTPEMQAEQEEIRQVRSARFRRQVVEAYDYRCTTCRMRIWLPPEGLAFVDAAHLIPFAVSANDHPSNGLSLCKNHHWALDQGLIAPDTDGVWRVSARIDPRRSRGEEELFKLRDTRLPAPIELAFAPDPESLAWRSKRLLD